MIDKKEKLYQGTGRLENIKGSELRSMSIIKMMKFTNGLSRWLDIHDHRCVFAYRRTYHQTTIGIPKRQLTVFLVIAVNDVCVKVMQFNKGPETGITVLLVVLVEMFNQYGYLQQVMELSKGEHINRDEQNTGKTFHRMKIQKKGKAFAYSFSEM